MNFRKKVNYIFLIFEIFVVETHAHNPVNIHLRVDLCVDVAEFTVSLLGNNFRIRQN